MPRFAPRYTLLIALLAAALAIRLAAGAWWQTRLGEAHSFAFGDSQSYWVLAQAISSGQPYRYGAGQAWMFRAPGYPVLLAAMFQLTGDDPPVIWARVLGAVLGAAAVAAVVVLTWKLFDETTALLAGLLAALYPGAVAMSILVLSEAPFCPLFLGQLVCWTAAWRTELKNRALFFALAGGLLAGAATLMRPSWLLFTPFALTVGLTFFSRRHRQLLIGAGMLAALAVVMLPWWMRNYTVSGRFVPTTTQVGASLYDGLNPGATGASDMRFVERFYNSQLQQDAVAPQPAGELFESRLDRRMRNEAIQWAANNPKQVGRLAAIKLWRTWRPWPNPDEFKSWTMRTIVAAGYVPLIVGALWGLWRYGRRDWPYLLCALPAVYTTLLHVVFVGSIRYRQPPMLALIVLAAGVFAPPLILRLRRIAHLD